MNKRIWAVFCGLAVLAAGGCAEDNINETESEEVKYKVILGGENSVYPIDEEKYSFPVSKDRITVPEGMTNRTGYDHLDKKGRDIYNLLLNSMKNCETESTVPNVDSTGKLYTRILELIRLENPAIFHIESRSIGSKSIASQSFKINFAYKYTAEEVNTMLREAEKAADKIMLKITADMDEYDIVKLFHDSLIQNTVNDENAPYADNVYGALADGRAHCEGYAKAFSYLCGRAGIENAVVTGRTNTNHMWNMVKLEGNWYHVDVTWDHPPGIITENYPDAVMYNYFLVSDAEILRERTIDSSITEPPKATGSMMNYFYKEGMYADSYEAALDCIQIGCGKAVENGSHSFMIKLASDELYENVIEGLYARNPEPVPDKPKLKEKDRNEGHNTDISSAMAAAGFTGRISYTNMFSAERIIMFMLDY